MRIILISLVFLHGCLSGFKAENPTVTIITPDDQADIESCFEIGIEVENFILDPDHLGQNAVDGHGHAHVKLSKDDETMEKIETITSETAWVSFSPDTFPAGFRTLMVTLADNDHAELEFSDTIEIHQKDKLNP